MPYPELGSLPVGRLRAGEAGLPQVSGTTYFGSATAVLDEALAVGAPGSDGLGGTSRGSVWVFSLRSNGSAASYTEIGDGTVGSQSGESLSLSDYANFGHSVAWLGDLDEDGHPDLAVGSTEEYLGSYGSVYILYLDASRRLRRYLRISQGMGGFDTQPPLSVRSGENHDRFGYSLATMPDLVGGGSIGLAVGATTDMFASDVHIEGTVFILSLNPDGTVRGAPVRIEYGSAGFTPTDLGRPPGDGPDRFASSLALLPDIDGNGVPELVVGATDIKGRCCYLGAIYILKLTAK